MAHKVPKQMYERRVSITDHAVESLLERMDKGRHGHREPWDLGNLLDKVLAEKLYGPGKDNYEQWYEAINDGEVVLNYVVGLGGYFEDLYGVVRRDSRGRCDFACITVLTSNMVNRNKTNGQWARTPDKLGDTTLKSSPFSALSSFLPKVPPSPPVESERKGEPARSQQKVLVMWTACSEERRAILLPNQVENFVRDLLEKGVELDNITLWAQRELKIQRTVNVDFDL